MKTGTLMAWALGALFAVSYAGSGASTAAESGASYAGLVLPASLQLPPEPRWVQLLRDEDGARRFVLSGSIKQAAGLVEFITLVNFSDARPVPLGARSAVYRLRALCDGHVSATASAALFSQLDGQGGVLFATDQPQPGQPFSPGSISAMVCEGGPSLAP